MLQSKKSFHGVSLAESALIDAVTEIGFGEIADVEVEDQPLAHEKPLTEKQFALLEYIRQGHQCIDKITIHEAEPVQIDMKMVIGGFRCTRKLRM